MPIVLGFSNEITWRTHFGKHGHKVGAKTKEIYLAKAKALLAADLATNSDISECTNSNGNILRFNRQTDEFAVMTATGIIKTYFKPTPLHGSPATMPRDQKHQFKRNIEYFNSECGK